jgi:hypothetical protein
MHQCCKSYISPYNRLVCAITCSLWPPHSCRFHVIVQLLFFLDLHFPVTSCKLCYKVSSVSQIYAFRENDSLQHQTLKNMQKWILMSSCAQEPNQHQSNYFEIELLVCLKHTQVLRWGMCSVESTHIPSGSSLNLTSSAGTWLEVAHLVEISYHQLQLPGHACIQTVGIHLAFYLLSHLGAIQKLMHWDKFKHSTAAHFGGS